jgi:hypothetical protein
MDGSCGKETEGQDAAEGVVPVVEQRNEQDKKGEHTLLKNSSALFLFKLWCSNPHGHASSMFP